MQHHSHYRPAWPLAPVRPAQPPSLTIGLRPRVAPAKAVTLNQMLMRMLGREPGVALTVMPLDLLGLLIRNRSAGPPPEPAGPSAHPRHLPRTAASSAETSARSSPTTPPPPVGSISPNPNGSTHREVSTSSGPTVARSRRMITLQKGHHAPDRSPAAWIGRIVCSLPYATPLGR